MQTMSDAIERELFNNADALGDAVWIEHHIRFDKKVGDMPCVLCYWSDNVDMVKDYITVFHPKMQIRSVTQPVDAIEIIGARSRLLLRDHNMMGFRRNHHYSNDKIRLYDQFVVIQQANHQTATLFAAKLLDHIAANGKLKVTVHNAKYRPDAFLNQQTFTIRNKEGYMLSCVTVINPGSIADNPDSCELFLHWKIDYVAPSKGQSDNAAEDSNVSDSPKTT